MIFDSEEDYIRHALAEMKYAHERASAPLWQRLAQIEARKLPPPIFIVPTELKDAIPIK